MRELRADVAVIGGGVGGVSAALAAVGRGARVVLTEETDWIGGQLTSQAVPPDEHPWIESIGRTRSYQRFRTGVRDYYRRHYPLTAAARANVFLNPGNGGVSSICHEPRVALAVLESMLAPAISAGRLTILRQCKPVAATVDGDRIRSVVVAESPSGERYEISAVQFIDATELGDLLPLAGAEWVSGFESQRDSGEPGAPAEAQPDNVQAFTVCFAMEYCAGEDHTIDRPAQYSFWRDYVPQLKPAWTGPLLSWDGTHPITLEPRTLGFNPDFPGEWEGDLYNMFTYRRIYDPTNFEGPLVGGPVTLVNWPQNDYLPGNLIGASEADFERHVEGGSQLSLSLLYWLQTEAGWKGLRLRPDLVGTAHGCAKYPYIRESRRIRAEFTVREQHISAAARAKVLGCAPADATAERFADSVGIGAYRIDLHPSTGGDNYLDISSCPFQIPLGALIPRRLDNLIAGAKNIGTTHITNGCYRLHPVEWNIGEAAGTLAATAVANNLTPRAIRNSPVMLEEFQAGLRADGVETEWPRLRAL